MNMRMQFLFFICILPMLGCMLGSAQSTEAHDTVAAQDSTVDVIGWFEKGDTLDYWIQESGWKIGEKDTIMTSGVSSKVRIVVTDSTSKGYKMDYTFLDFRGDTLANSKMGQFQNYIVEKFGKKIMGTTVRFETDEYGEITKFTNLSQIKKQAKSVFKDVMEEVFTLDEVKEMEEAGIDMKGMLKNVDADDLVEGYLEELKMLFAYHGRSFKTGEYREHEDSTATSYECDTYTDVYKNSDDGTYEIISRAVNIIPKAGVKAFIGGIAGQYTDKTSEEIDKALDKVFDTDATYEDYLGMKYLGYGMPYDVLKQTTTKINGVGRVKQTYIYLDGISD